MTSVVLYQLFKKTGTGKDFKSFGEKAVIRLEGSSNLTELKKAILSQHSTILGSVDLVSMELWQGKIKLEEPRAVSSIVTMDCEGSLLNLLEIRFIPLGGGLR